MTKKFDNFCQELEALCKKHGVSICTSMYDHIEVWDYDREAFLTGIEDCTKGITAEDVEQAKKDTDDLERILE